MTALYAQHQQDLYWSLNDDNHKALIPGSRVPGVYFACSSQSNSDHLCYGWWRHIPGDLETSRLLSCPSLIAWVQ